MVNVNELKANYTSNLIPEVKKFRTFKITNQNCFLKREINSY